MKIEKEALKLLEQFSKIRTYNSCGVFKGVMIRDNEKAHRLIMKARKIMKRIYLQKE